MPRWPSTRLPHLLKHPVLLQTYGVARNTARKALLMLADQGYVRIVPVGLDYWIWPGQACITVRVSHLVLVQLLCASGTAVYG